METMCDDRKASGRTGGTPRRILVGVAVVLLACVSSAAQETAAEPIKPIDAVNLRLDALKVELGRRLFHEPRLSKNNTVSCATCHDLKTGGDDGRVVSIGIEDREGLVNAPTVFNSGFNFKQFWDGRAHTLREQIDGPVQSAVEMESIWPDVVSKLFKDPDYPRRFEQLYPDSITRENIKDAIAEFVRSLVTPNSRFDRWLKGDASALSAHELEGYALFKRYGCVSCHQGANVGGNMFQVFGVINDYFTKRGDITDADLGRFNVTGNEADRHAFKVPSLRMAAHTAPYLHDGSAATLRDAVDAMFEFQLGREAPDEHKEAIVAFIETLSGEYYGDARQLGPMTVPIGLRAPQMQMSGPGQDALVGNGAAGSVAPLPQGTPAPIPRIGGSSPNGQTSGRKAKASRGSR